MHYYHSPEENAKFKVWDCGGQTVFYTMHHLFFSEYALCKSSIHPHSPCFMLVELSFHASPIRCMLVVILCRSFSPDPLLFNMEDVLNPEKRETALGFLSFWIKSIVTHSLRRDKSAPIFLVGTRGDTVTKQEDHK